MPAAVCPGAASVGEGDPSQLRSNAEKRVRARITLVPIKREKKR